MKKIFAFALIFCFFVNLFVFSIQPNTSSPIETPKNLDTPPIASATLPIFHDDFESYLNAVVLATKWFVYYGSDCLISIDDTVAYEGERCVKLFDNSSSEIVSLVKSFTPVLDFLYVSLYLRANTLAGTLFIQLRALNTAGWTNWHVKMGQINNKWMIATQGGVLDTGYTYNADQWYKVELLMNCHLGTWSGYVDNQLIFENYLPWGDTGARNVSQIILSTPISGGIEPFAYFADDIVIRQWHIRNDTVINGTQIGDFNEKLLLDVDGYSHVIQSAPVSNDQKVTVQYSYNFSEFPQDGLEQIGLNYAFKYTPGYSPSGSRVKTVSNFQNWSDPEEKLVNLQNQLNLYIDGNIYQETEWAYSGWGTCETYSGSYTDTRGYDLTYWQGIGEGTTEELYCVFINPSTQRQYFETRWATSAQQFGLSTDWGNWYYSMDNINYYHLDSLPERGVWYAFWDFNYVISGEPIAIWNSQLGGTLPPYQYQKLSRSQAYFGAQWRWDYAHVNYRWVQYFPYAVTESPEYTLSSGTTYKELQNITINFGNYPDGTQVSLSFKALTPDGWTGWISIDSGANINLFASKIKLKMGLYAEQILLQKTPKINSVSIYYGNLPSLDTTISIYNNIDMTWDPIIISAKNDLTTQYESNYIFDDLSRYLNDQSLLFAKVETNSNGAQFLLNIDQLNVDLGEPIYHLFVVDHKEDGLPVPPGVLQINNELDFNVSLTYGTRIGPYHTTWTNVSINYKINQGAWQGPYFLGKSFGNGTASFIIGKNNYSTNDHLYYYFSFEQYDNESILHARHFWTQDGSFIIEHEARSNAFHKRVGSLLYDLRLNYSIWFKAESSRIFGTDEGNITMYPWVRIAYDNISVSFYNTTATQTNFSVFIENGLKLNHYLADDSRNISKFDEPQINLSTGLKSPFTLPINTLPPWILVPSISYDSFFTGRNLTFTGDYLNITYRSTEKFPYPHRTVLKYVSETNNTIIRFDIYTGLMVYYSHIDTTANASKKIIIALIDNNQSYPINLKVEQRLEIADSGEVFKNNTIYHILYDPPGDHSYTQISAGTTIRNRCSLKTFLSEGLFLESNLLGEAGESLAEDGLDLDINWVNSTTYDKETIENWTTTITSSLESEDPDFIGPGYGDIYILVGLVIQYWFLVNNYYIVYGNSSIETPDNYADPPNNYQNDICVWEQGSTIDCKMAINTSKVVTNTYLEQYNVSYINNENIFADNYISTEESDSVELIKTELITPENFFEMYYSFGETKTKLMTDIFYISLDKVFAWEVEPDPLAGIPFLPVVGSKFESEGKLGINIEYEKEIIDISANSTNKEIMVHIEDDDGSPLGQHDQFLINLYRDKIFQTFGVTYEGDYTYTSRPFEYGTKDRRLPTISEIIELDEYISGRVNIICAAKDEETGVSIVEIYFNKNPIFSFEDSIKIGSQNIPITGFPDLYQISWNTSTFQGTYYLFVVTYDDSDPLKNYLISNKYRVQVDNIIPILCEVFIYEPYNDAITLYANALDLDSGIEYIEYWDGDPDDQNSTRLGISYDSSSAFQFIWLTDPNGIDDGIHNIYARAFDRAGTYLVSEPLQITVNDSLPKSSGITNQDILLISILVVGSIGIGLYLLDLLYLRRRQPARVTPQKQIPSKRKEPTFLEKPPKGA